jgi:hypothetical protein
LNYKRWSPFLLKIRFMRVFLFSGVMVVVGAFIGTSLPVHAAKPLPPGAKAVIQSVHAAAGQQRHAALQRLMAPEFVWSFGGDADAQQAIAAWKADPKALKALHRATGMPCAALPDGGVECPRQAGRAARACFEPTAQGWRMVSFVAGD